MTNIYIDARPLQSSKWQGQQFYIYHILREMIPLGKEHTFHLHFGWDEWHPQIDTLLAHPNTVAHKRQGRIWSHASVPLEILRSRSKVFYRMYNEDKPMPTPVPVPMSILINDNGRHVCPELFNGPPASTIREATTKAIRNFDRIITISETVKNETMALFGIPSERILLAPCAVIPPEADAPEARPPALPEGVPFFLMVNPGGWNKNWQGAFAAFSLLMQAHPDLKGMRLVLAGNLRYEQERAYAAIAADPILQEGVDCLGYVSDEELRYLYRHARVSVFPTRFEGFGIPALESLVYDLPLVVSDIPIMREVSGGAALFAELDCNEALMEAMYRATTDEPLRASLIEKGRTHAAAYSWRNSAQNTLEALLSLA